MSTTTKAPERFTVTKHNTTLTVYPYAIAKDRPGWRFAWKDTRDGGKWKYITRRTREEAKAAALEKLEEIAWGGLAWSALPSARQTFLATVHGDTHPDDERRVLAFAYSLRREREQRAATSAAVPPAEAEKSDTSE